MRRIWVWLLVVVASLASGEFQATAQVSPGQKPSRQVGLFPRDPEASAKAVRVGDEFQVSLFAADPHLASPVAMTFDADGDVYVAEMLDYPIIRTPGMFGPFPEGQIRKLVTDDSGRVVRSTVFASAISAPASVLPYDGGVLVAAAPDILFFKDTDGDGHADVRKVVLTGFDASQDLYRVNSLLWGVDGWVYARGVGDTPVHWGDDVEGPALSTSGMNFRFRPRDRKFEPVSGMASCFGLTTDDWGHLFFSNSANHVYQVVLADKYVRRNPYMVAPGLYREISDHGGVAEIFRVSPPQPWRVERSELWEKTGLTKKFFGDIEPRQDYMTAVCGPIVYRGAAFPEAYRGNYFVCEAVSNLVHRDRLAGPGPVYTASRADAKKEFLASEDNWCSPVYLDAGPDGALYVVDMYRQIIEHAGPDGGRDVPNVPLEILNKYGLRAGSTMGRIYRVAPAGMAKTTRPRLSKADSKGLAEALGSADAWWRTTAQRLILEDPANADVATIRNVALASPHAPARVQALWTLEALGKLDGDAILTALKQPVAGVRENALRMAEGKFATDPKLAEAALGMTGDADPAVRYQLALSLGEVPSPARVDALAKLVASGADDPYLRAAVLSSAAEGPLELFKKVAAGPHGGGVDDFLRETAGVIGARLDKDEIAGLLESTASDKESSANVLQGLAGGIRRRGKKGLDIPAARGPLTRLEAAKGEETRKAAVELATLIRALSAEEREALVKGEAATALDEKRDIEERVRAVDALGAVEAEGLTATLGELLHPRQPQPLQDAALRALGERSGGSEVVAVLAENWKGLTPEARKSATEVALGRKDRLGPLLEALAAGKIPAEDIDPGQRARLLGSTDRAIASAARETLGAASKGIDAKLFDRFKPALALQGDHTKGAATFKKLCIGCHKAGGEGAEVGPNLASVRNRPREQVLQDILFPNTSFAPQYHQYVVATTDGKLLTGLLASSNAAGYTIRRQGGEEVTVLRKDVDELSDTRVSLMPEKLLDGLSPQDVANLLEFVRSAP